MTFKAWAANCSPLNILLECKEKSVYIIKQVWYNVNIRKGKAILNTRKAIDMKKMPYSLYKNYYNQFRAEEYDSKTKTIMVDIPDVKRKQFPKEWRRDGNRYYTLGGCEVYFWNTGLSENFVVTRNISAYQRYTKTICPGIDARDKVIEIVKLFESK